MRLTSARRPGTAVLTVTAILLFLFPAAALAHTGFDYSSPVDGAVIDTPVEEITIAFTGEAEPTGDGFQVLDPAGVLRSPNQAATADGQTWQLRFDPPLLGGDVGVRWKVKAADAHPIEGSFSFTVTAMPVPVLEATELEPDAVDGATAGSVNRATPERAPDLASFLAVDAAGDGRLDDVAAIARVLSLSGTLVGLGALLFAATVLRGPVDDIWNVLFWVRRAAVVVVVGSALEFGAQLFIEAGDVGLSALYPSTVVDVVLSSFGLAVALRVMGGLALAAGADMTLTSADVVPDPVMALRERVGVGAGGALSGPADAVPRHAQPPVADAIPYLYEGDAAWRPTPESASALLGAGLLLLSHLFDGHTVTEGNRVVTGVAALVHVAGAAVWVGGVVMLAVVLWRRHRQGRTLRALQLAVRFSVIASVAIVAVGLAGVVLSVIVLETPSQLWSTGWGQLLIAKLLVVGLAAASGAYNHKILIPQMANAPSDQTRPAHFRTVVTVEAAVLVTVVVLTAFLVGASAS